MSENLNRDFSKYDTMETGELEKILRLDAESPEGGESDTELLLYVMEVLASRRDNTNFTGNTAQKAWESFQKNYIPDECVGNAPSKIRKHTAAPWLHRLIAVAAVIVLVICIPVTARALSLEKLWDIFARWAKETFSFVSGENTEVSEPSPDFTEEFNSLQELLLYCDRESDIIPTWIPEGFVLEKVEQDISPVQEIYRAFYLNGDRELRIRVQTYLSDDIQNIEIGEDYTEIHTVSGVDYFIFDNIDQAQVIWINDVYECIISGDLSIEEIKLMIDSIEKG